MKLESTQTITVKLELSEEEATWLMHYVQNSPDPQESPEDGKKRRDLFDGLRRHLQPTHFSG